MDLLPPNEMFLQIHWTGLLSSTYVYELEHEWIRYKGAAKSTTRYIAFISFDAANLIGQKSRFYTRTEL